MQPFGKSTGPNKKSLFLWGGFLTVGLCLVLGLVWFGLFHQKTQRAEQALTNAQQVTLLLGTGELIKGNLIPEKPVVVPATLPPPETEQATEKPSQEETTATAVETPTATSQAPATPSAAEQAGAASAPATAAPTGSTIPAVFTPNGKPKIAVIIGGLGLSRSVTEQALTLPPGITLGFSPYAHTLTDWFNKAKASGHESFLQIPVEPGNYPAVNPGPFALLTELSPEDNKKRLDWILSRGDGYQGVYTEADERFTDSEKQGNDLRTALQQKGLLFVYGKGYRNDAFLQQAGANASSMLVNDVFIDERISAGAIQSQFARLEAAAKKNGYAIAIGSPYPITFKLLEKWLGLLDAKGFQLVPVSQVTK